MRTCRRIWIPVRGEHPQPKATQTMSSALRSSTNPHKGCQFMRTCDIFYSFGSVRCTRTRLINRRAIRLLRIGGFRRSYRRGSLVVAGVHSSWCHETREDLTWKVVLLSGWPVPGNRDYHCRRHVIVMKNIRKKLHFRNGIYSCQCECNSNKTKTYAADALRTRISQGFWHNCMLKSSSIMSRTPG